MSSRAPVRYKINLKIEPPFSGKVDPKVLRAAARAALTHQAASAPAELSLLITDDDALHVLNRQFLGHDHPTDVLSFPSDEIDSATSRRYLGDVAISYPTARRQAKQAAHPVRAELQLLIVHGVLHLLGYDHANAAEKRKMWAAQSEILMALQAGFTAPPG